MRALPWGYLFVTALVLSMLVGSSLGASVPPWIKKWLNILWSIGCVVFLIGIPLAFMNETRTTTVDGGYRITLQTPQFIMVVFGAVVMAALVTAAIGVCHIVIASRSAARDSIASGRERIRVTVEHANWQGVSMGVVLLIAGCALSYFGGPIAITETGIIGGLTGLISAAGIGVLVGGAMKVVNSLWPKSKIHP